MGVLVAGSARYKSTGLVQSTDGQAVGHAVPGEPGVHGDGSVELALSR
jgi:hypothetical protein